MKTEDKEFEPYGPEWEKEMLKFTKIGLIQMLRKSLKENLSTDMAYEKGWTDATREAREEISKNYQPNPR